MTVYPLPPARDKASCEKWWCRWSDTAKTQKHAKLSAQDHARRRGHREFEINGYHMRFEGQL